MSNGLAHFHIHDWRVETSGHVVKSDIVDAIDRVVDHAQGFITADGVGFFGT